MGMLISDESSNQHSDRIWKLSGLISLTCLPCWIDDNNGTEHTHANTRTEADQQQQFQIRTRWLNPGWSWKRVTNRFVAMNDGEPTTNESRQGQIEASQYY